MDPPYADRRVRYPKGALIARRYRVADSHQGGMGVVYICEDEVDHIALAVKVLRRDYLRDIDHRKSFVRECDNWLTLEVHPHIVPAYWVEHLKDTGEFCIVVESVSPSPGKREASLAAWIDPANPLAPKQACSFTLDIIRGLRHCTSVLPGFVHGDLKPSNVLIGTDGVAKVTDFGLSRLRSGGRESRRSGTYGYMAPEQWDGTGPDCRADIYSTGCILYEMLTGEKMLADQSENNPGAPRSLPSTLPSFIRELFEQCTVPLVDQRLPNWEIVEALTVQIADSLALDHRARKHSVVVLNPRALRRGYAASFNELGTLQQTNSSDLQAVTLFERALTIARQEDDASLQCSILTNLGNSVRHLGDRSRAVQCHLDALRLACSIRHATAQGNALGCLSADFLLDGDIEKAMEYAHDVLKIAIGLSDLSMEALSYEHLGECYFNSQDSKKAREFFERQRTTALSKPDPRVEARALFNLARVCRAEGALAKALELLERAGALADEVADLNFIVQINVLRATVLGERAVAIGAQGTLGAAELEYERALALAQAIPDKKLAALLASNFASVYSELL